MQLILELLLVRQMKMLDFLMFLSGNFQADLKHERLSVMSLMYIAKGIRKTSYHVLCFELCQTLFLFVHEMLDLLLVDAELGPVTLFGFLKFPVLNKLTDFRTLLFCVMHAKILLNLA